MRENGNLRLVGAGTLTAGAVDISVTETVKGSDTITARYGGDSMNLPSRRTMTQTMTSAPAQPLPRPTPKILSASWGTDNAVGCPSGQRGLDNIPVTFNWFIRGTSIQTTDFQIVRSDGTTATPTCALQFPPDEADEAQTVNLIGDFGDAVHGPTPVGIRIVGACRAPRPEGSAGVRSGLFRKPPSSHCPAVRSSSTRGRSCRRSTTVTRTAAPSARPSCA